MRAFRYLLRILLGLIIIALPFGLLRTSVRSQPPDGNFSIHREDSKKFDDGSYSFNPATSGGRSLNSLTTQGSVTQNLSREVLGFAPYWTLSSVKNYDFSYLSTVAYFGVDIDGNNGNLITGNAGWNGWASADLQTLVTNAHAKGTRVVLTVKLFDTLNNGGTKTLGGFLANTTSQQNAINQIVSEVKAKGVEGVNVDFEPTDASSATAAQKSAFATFLTNLTNQLRSQVSGAQVTVDTYACAARGASPCSTSSFFDVVALAATPIDAMLVMAYDFHGPNSTVIAPTSPLNGYPSNYWYDVTTAVNDYLGKVSPDKIILGVPYYGVKMSTADSSENSSSLGNGANPSYAVTRSDIACLGASTGWDNAGKVARAYWFSDSSKSSCGTVWNQWRQIYYDDPAALGHKYDLVNSKNLKGIGIWALGYDGSYYSELAAPVKEKLSYGQSYRAGQLVVKYKPGTTQAQISALDSKYGTTSTKLSGQTDYRKLSFNSIYSVVDMAKNFRSEGIVDSATPNFVRKVGVFPTTEPDDPYYHQNPTDLNSPAAWNFSQIGALTAWQVNQGGSSGVKVAVIDTGVAFENYDPDGVGPISFAKAPDFVSASFVNPINILTSVDANGDGDYIDAGDTLDPHANDDYSHGTYVTSIIAEETNNGLGSSGLSWKTGLMPIKVCDSQGSCADSDIVAGINYAVSNGAKVINLSLGGPDDNPVLRDAIKSAVSSGVVVVAASGNDNSGQLSYPARYDEVVAVGAVNSDGSRSVYSNYGPGIDLMAPVGTTGSGNSCIDGQSIRYQNLVPSGQNYTSFDYSCKAGTSFAAPQVSAVAALLLASGVPTGGEVLRSLLNSATDLGSGGYDTTFGYGRLNAGSALNYKFIVGYDLNTLPNQVFTGQSISAGMTVTNRSSSIWPSGGTNPVNLAYHWVDSQGKTVVWDGNRASLSSDLSPGASIVLTGTVVVPSQPGTYTLRWDMVQELISWFSWQGNYTSDVKVTVNPAKYNLSFDTLAIPTVIKSGSSVVAPVTVTNKGLPWTSAGTNPVHLSYHWLNSQGQVVTWDGERTALLSDMDYQDQVSLSASIKSPDTPGEYILRLDMVKELATWFSWQGGTKTDYPVSVVSADSSALRAIFNENNSPTTLISSKNYSGLNFKVLNNGTETWASASATPVRLAYHIRDKNNNLVTWDGERSVLATDIASGGIATISASFKAPSNPGTYKLEWDMVKEFETWFNWVGSKLLSVTAQVLPNYGVNYQRTHVPEVMRKSATETVKVKLQNTSSATWNYTGSNPVRLSYHWVHADTGQTVVWDGLRTNFTAEVAPLGSATLDMQISAPDTVGNYRLEIDLVKELVTWFSWQGVNSAVFPVTIVQ